MEQFWRKKSFKVLLTTWNKKLEKSGFKDAEAESKFKDERTLRQRAARKCFSRADDFERETTLEYYCFLGHLAHNTIFPNELEKIIMIRHSEGATYKEIAQEIGRHRHSVEFIIKRWQTKWGVKRWSLQAQGLKKKDTD
jgi:hypothetical protein